jgi:hypothetical protein
MERSVGGLKAHTGGPALELCPWLSRLTARGACDWHPENADANHSMTPSKPFDFHRLALVVASVGTLFWLYTFYAIDHVPVGDGTGFQWLAVIPLGAIFAGFFLPAWLLVVIGRLPRFTVALGVCGLIAFAVVWSQLLAEFPKAKLY